MSICSKVLCAILPLFLLTACSKEPLTKDKAQELIEASDEFQLQTVHVRLTEDEVKKGIEAGYWVSVEMNRTNSALPHMQILSLTPIGAALFRGAPPLNSPVMQINQKLGARVIEIGKIEDDSSDPKLKTVDFTWSRRFENQVPELADMFKDQPAQQARKKFRYGNSAWELAP